MKGKGKRKKEKGKRKKGKGERGKGKVIGNWASGMTFKVFMTEVSILVNIRDLESLLFGSPG